VFGEVIPAAVACDGSHYFNKCWRHAAGHVVSPPLRHDALTNEHLIDLLAKYVNPLMPTLYSIRPQSESDSERTVMLVLGLGLAV